MLPIDTATLSAAPTPLLPPFVTLISILGLSPFETTGDDQEVALVGGLHPAVTYTFRIFAINSIDASAPTETVVAKTQEEGKCFV